MSRNKEILKRKTILFVEQNQDGTTGGSHFCLLYLIDSLNRERYQPIIMFYEKNNIIDRFLTADCHVIVFKKPLGRAFKAPCTILELPYIIAQKTYNYVSTSLVPFVRFILFIIKNNIDLVHLNNTASGGWEWLLAARLLRRKCVTHQRGFARFDGFARRRARYFDKIVCVSKAVENYLKEKGIINNVITIYDCMVPQAFTKQIRKTIFEVKKEFNVGSDIFFIGMVGNFQEWKGQLTVIKAVALLRKKYPEVVCLLSGDVSSYKRDVEYFKKVRQEIHDRNLKKNIIITGYRLDVPDLINSLDIMIHASIEPEPFGMVILEGMCLEKPVIATDIGGPREIIEDGVSGILVPPGKPIILAEKIEYLLEHPDVRQEIGKNALKRVLDKFNLDKFFFQVNNLYDGLFSK